MATYYNNNIPDLECQITPDDIEWEDIDDVIDVSYTMSFYPDEDQWLCAHDYIPQGMFATRSGLYLFNDKELYIHNQDNFAKYFKGNVFNSLISPVYKSPYVTRNKYVSALFTNVLFRCDIIVEKRVDRNKTLSFISLHNSYQSSDRIELIPFDDTRRYLDQYDNHNIRLSHNYWQFNKFRDLKIDKRQLTWEEWETINNVVFTNKIAEIDIDDTNLDDSQHFRYKRRFEDEYLIAIFEYDNTEQHQFLLHDVSNITLPTLR